MEWCDECGKCVPGLPAVLSSERERLSVSYRSRAKLPCALRYAYVNGAE